MAKAKTSSAAEGLSTASTTESAERGDRAARAPAETGSTRAGNGAGAKGRTGSAAPVDEKEAKAKSQSLDFAISQIRKKCGQGSIMYLGADHKANVNVISTGSLALDAALGVGGVPRGRIVEIYGPESSGKTTLTLQIVANAQRAGGTAAFIDAEHALDPSYARRLGVDLDGLLVSQPDSGEQALEIAEMLVSSNAVDVVVIDSVAALVPRAELEGEMGDSHVGLQARLMSQALRKLTGLVNKSQTCFIFINQIREKIGVMFGSPETTSGGRALKFYASVRMDIRRIASIKEGDSVRGSRTRVKVVKNKVAAPFRQAEFDILFNRGISLAGDVLDLAVEHGAVERSGSWHSYKETRIGQGRDRAVQFLEENPEIFTALIAEVRSSIGLEPPRSAPAPQA
ncbi:MAG: recombinase RecA [Planctomycetes bacterium]|nr:recombinase RecA [Planctomycetota bacterium]